MLRGGCLCGGIRYEINGQIGSALYCHCSMCRKWHGTAFRTRLAVPRTSFRFVQGEDLLVQYRSSADTIKTFCRTCGSPMVNSWDPDPENTAWRWELLMMIPASVRRITSSWAPRLRGTTSPTTCRSSIRFRHRSDNGVSSLTECLRFVGPLVMSDDAERQRLRATTRQGPSSSS